MAWSKPPPASLTLWSRPSPALTLLAMVFLRPRCGAGNVRLNLEENPEDLGEANSTGQEGPALSGGDPKAGWGETRRRASTPAVFAGRSFASATAAPVRSAPRGF